MDSTDKNPEDIDSLITEIKKKLDLVNEQMLKSQDYRAEHYDQLLDIYEMIKDKSSVSIMEKEAIISELGKLRSDSSE